MTKKPTPKKKPPIEKESKKSNRGGPRPNAGRKKGLRNRLTQESVAAAKATGDTPLKFMLDIMRDANADMKLRFVAAKEAAPYVHPKLASLTHSGQIDIKLWSDDELSLAEQLLGEIEARKSR